MEGRIPWAIVNVIGVIDIPVAWASGEPDFSMNGGKNGYTIVVLPEDQYILYTFHD